MEFYDLGKRCSLPDCQQHDYLPFFCKQCVAWYCLDHKNVDHHINCSGRLDRKVPTCPACNAPVPTSPDEDPNTTISRHLEEVCKNSNSRTIEQSKKTKKKCEVSGCRQILGATKPVITCTRCYLTLCLAHRFPEQHHCGDQARRQRLANAAEQRRLHSTVFMLRVH